MLRVILLSIVLFASLSCEKPAEPAGSTPPKPAAEPSKSASPSAKAPDQPGSAIPDVKEAVGTAKAEGESALGDLKKATANTKEAAEAVPAIAKEAVKDAAKSLPDLSKVTEPSFTVEKLKEILGSLSIEKLKELADQLSAAISKKDGVVKGFREEIASLGVTDLGKAGGIKKNLDSALASLTDLKEKLKLVTDKLGAAK